MGRPRKIPRRSREQRIVDYTFALWQEQAELIRAEADEMPADSNVREAMLAYADFIDGEWARYDAGYISFEQLADVVGDVVGRMQEAAAEGFCPVVTVVECILH
jgi:hypothetical protein